jgi:phosphopantothenoylcysteine decarboxylase/phosphopantothenate--cysteine ligase
MLPHAVRGLKAFAPQLDVRVGLTTAACQFVTPTAMSLISGRPVVIDRWAAEEDRGASQHVELVEWADAFVVYPATAHLVARLAVGLCDTPILTALASTRAPIGIAPNLPPGMVESPVHQRHLAELSAWPNVVVARTHTGVSATTGREEDGAAGPITEVLALMRSRFFADDLDWPHAGESDGGSRSLASTSLSWTERLS